MSNQYYIEKSNHFDRLWMWDGKAWTGIAERFSGDGWVFYGETWPVDYNPFERNKNEKIETSYENVFVDSI